MGYTPHVLVIGGGVLGTAIARDLAIRGFETTLLEQGTLTTGASGRMQGVLYSGARVAAADPAGAKRCRKESAVLRRIADEYVRETGGVIAAPPGEQDRLDELFAAAEQCDISAEELTGESLHSAVASLSSSVSRGAKVDDAVVDPFGLTLANAASAETYGADVQTGAEVTELVFEGGRIAGATVSYDSAPDSKHPQPGDRSDIEPPGADDIEVSAAETQDEEEDEEDEEDQEDQTAPEPVAEVQRAFPGGTESSQPDSGSTEQIEADFVVNATGAWADRIAAMAGIDLGLSRVRGTMAVLPGEQTNAVLSRYGDASERRHLAPFWGNAVLGAVSEPLSEAGDTAAAAETLLDDAATFLDIEDPEPLRSYTGLWTTHAGADAPPQGPGATIIDHGQHDDRWGMLTVLGGTVTTHRAVAESVVDRICLEFGIARSCRTDEISLPAVDSERATPSDAASGAMARAKQAVSGLSSPSEGANPVLCETKDVRREAVQSALDEATSVEGDLSEIRLRTGAAMGECQGGRCAHRLAAQLYPTSDLESVEAALSAFLARRWAGRRQALWGDQLSAAMADQELHTRTLARDLEEPSSFEEFDDGPEAERRERRPMCCEAVIP